VCVCVCCVCALRACVCVLRVCVVFVCDVCVLSVCRVDICRRVWYRFKSCPRPKITVAQRLEQLHWHVKIQNLLVCLLACVLVFVWCFVWLCVVLCVNNVSPTSFFVTFSTPPFPGEPDTSSF